MMPDSDVSHWPGWVSLAAIFGGLVCGSPSCACSSYNLRESMQNLELFCEQPLLRLPITGAQGLPHLPTTVFVT